MSSHICGKSSAGQRQNVGRCAQKSDAMYFKNVDVIAALGAPLHSDPVQKVLRVFELDTTKIKIKRGECDAAIESKNLELF